MRLSGILSVILFFAAKAGAQSGTEDLVRDIAYYSDIMVTAEGDEHRLRAYDDFEKAMDGFLKSSGSYAIALDSIRWISVLKGKDFRLVTWQLKVHKNEYKYGGFIQWPDRIVRLKDTRPWVNGAQRMTYAPGAWYGALYYKLISFQKDQKDYYIVFGFNAENERMNTKVADILDLNGDEPVFGLPVFVGRDEPQSRLILQYADVSVLQLIYDEELKAVVHDHLSSIAGVGPDGTSLVVSDGSQEGWVFKNGVFQYQEEMYDVQMEAPPMTDDRKDRKEDKDILGRPKKP